MERTKVCGKCNGTGRPVGKTVGMCIHCHGRGRSETGAEKDARHAQTEALLASAKAPTGDTVSIAEMHEDHRSSWAPYGRYYSEVIMQHAARLSVEEYMACADYVTDYAGERWNGLKDVELSMGPAPSPYEPMPLTPIFNSPLDVLPPLSQDPPELLKNLTAVEASDTGSYFCYGDFWAAENFEDPSLYPFSFATVGSKGVHFFNHAHQLAVEYTPTERIDQIAGTVKGDCWLYLHREAKKVTLGALKDPADILMEFALPDKFQPHTVSVLSPVTSPVAAICGDNFRFSARNRETSALLTYDLQTGDMVSKTPLAIFDKTRRDPYNPLRAWGATADLVRPNVLYIPMLSMEAFAIVDTRDQARRAARVVRTPFELKSNIVMKPFGACDSLAMSNGPSVLLYDIVAAKFRHELKLDENVFSLTAFGRQLVLGQYSVSAKTSFVAWDSFENGPFYQAPCNPTYGTAAGNFIRANCNGLYRMNHNRCFHASWFPVPAGGVAMVDKAAAAPAPSAAPTKGRRAPRAAEAAGSADSFSPSLQIPIPKCPKFCKDQCVEIESVVQADPSTYLVSDMWVACDSKSPVRMLIAGENGFTTFDKDLKISCVWSKGQRVYRVAIDTVSDTLALGLRDGVALHKLSATAEQRLVIDGFSEEVRAIAVLSQRSSPTLLTSGYDRVVQIRDLGTGRRLGEMPIEFGGTPYVVHDIRADSHRPDVAYLGCDGQLMLVDLRKPPTKPVRVLTLQGVYNPRYSGVALADYGGCDKAAIGSQDCVQTFDIGTAKLLCNFAIPSVQALATYGDTLIAGGYDSDAAVRYFDWQTGAERASSQWGCGCDSLKPWELAANATGVYRRRGNAMYLFPFA